MTMNDQSLLNTLKDGFDRIATKLRISVTDRCNMRCMYCMPRDNISWLDHEDILNYDEITRLSNIFTGFGVNRIRITGGEPLIRPGIRDLISSLSKNNSIKTII